MNLYIKIPSIRNIYLSTKFYSIFSFKSYHYFLLEIPTEVTINSTKSFKTDHRTPSTNYDINMVDRDRERASFSPKPIIHEGCVSTIEYTTHQRHRVSDCRNEDCS